MNQLSYLQSAFQEYLLTHNSNIENEIQNIGGLNKLDRLAIYYDGYRLRLIECLAADFEKTALLLGEESFSKAALQYLDSHPSTFRSIRNFGEKFPEFLKTTSPYSDSQLLVEMAQFEWILGLTMDSADFIPLTMDTLKQTPMQEWPLLTFSLQPALFFFSAEFNTPQVWKVLEQDPDTQPEIRKEDYPLPKNWVVWRKGIMAHFYSLSAEEKMLLDALQSGQNFADLCELLTEKHDEEKIPLIAIGYLSKWINEQFFRCDTSLIKNN